jgi:signal transduction histidine kinase
VHPRPPRTIPLTITLGAGSVALGIALLVGWTLLIVHNWEETSGALNVWLLVAGIVSFVVIVTVLVTFSVLLVREIRTGLRQTSFIDSVTHELKSPLASMQLCLQTMERPDLAPAQRQALEDLMRGDVERLTLFIDDVLEASRLTYGRGPTRIADVPLAALARECAARVLGRYRAADDAVRVDVPEDLVVRTDPTALEIVLKNLIDNAMKYSDRPDGVVVSAAAEGRGRVAIEVRDRGVGIPPEALKRVFDRFYRVPDEATRARRGTGLGLYVVRTLVRNLGGRVEALSAGQGQGATLRVVLPAGATTPPGHASEPG